MKYGNTEIFSFPFLFEFAIMAICVNSLIVPVFGKVFAVPSSTTK